jgi:AraC-like DNA-binding protein
MDPMSDILGLLQPSSYGFRGLDAGGDWALKFDRVEGLKCHAIRSGSCWLRLDSGCAPVKLDAGDLILLTGTDGFQLHSDSNAEPVSGLDFFAGVQPGETATLNGGGDIEGVGGFFKFGSVQSKRLLGILPPLIHIRAGLTDGALIWLVGRLMLELRNPQPGGALVARHLAQAMLVEALRLHLADREVSGVGWIYALADPGIRAAMTAMHAEPAKRWKLEDLAAVAGMSRTSFANRFRKVSGETAMEYLTRWRMLLAADQMKDGQKSIAIIAPMVGYESESAFGAAFKKLLGQPPKRFAQLR